VAWPQYYLYDPVSYAALGAYELVNAWKDISPIDDTDAAITAAANTLYDCACAFLRKNATSQVVYQATAMWIPWTVRAGDKIRLVYTGAVMRDGVAYSFLDVDALYTILKITRRVNADGSTQATLEIASVDKRIMDDIGAITHMLESIGDYETRTQTYPSTIQDTNAGTLYGNPACYHYTPVRLAMASKYQACLYLDRATLTFKTDVMSYTASNFVVTQDTVYPSGITLSLLNEAGVATDVTTVLGGPWGDPAASVEATLDVTQLLRNATGGLKQSHRFRWACGSASRGKIEVTLRMAMTVQSYVRG
jgi:hypothetical protein